MQQCRKHLQRQVSPFDVAGLAAEKEELEKKMGQAAAELNFEEAANLRDRMIEVKKMLLDIL